MPNDILAAQPVPIRQVAHQLHQGLIGGVGELAGLVRVTALDGDGVVVAGVGAVGDLVEGDALDDLAVDADDEVAAGVGGAGLGETGEVAAVGFGGGVGVAGVVDDHAVDLFQRNLRTRVGVLRQ